MPDAEWHEQVYSGRALHVPNILEPGHRSFLADPSAPKRGRLLDVGCGAGNFLAAARPSGYQVAGIDLDRNAVRAARDHFGLENVWAVPLEQFEQEHRGEKFQVVTFFEVLEHQDQPKHFLELVKSLLMKRGYVALSVPNRERWQTGPEVLDLPPNHLTRWNPQCLSQFLIEHGFQVLSVREEKLGVRRAVGVLSMALRTGVVGKIMNGKSATVSELAAMSAEERVAALQGAASPRQRIASLLIHTKNHALYPIALALLPYLRITKRKGAYLYALARLKS
jgi:SAM-dependent methyltransferase